MFDNTPLKGYTDNMWKRTGALLSLLLCCLLPLTADGEQLSYSFTAQHPFHSWGTNRALLGSLGLTYSGTNSIKLQKIFFTATNLSGTPEFPFAALHFYRNGQAVGSCAVLPGLTNRIFLSDPLLLPADETIHLEVRGDFYTNAPYNTTPLANGVYFDSNSFATTAQVPLQLSNLQSNGTTNTNCTFYLVPPLVSFSNLATTQLPASLERGKLSPVALWRCAPVTNSNMFVTPQLKQLPLLLTNGNSSDIKAVALYLDNGDGVFSQDSDQLIGRSSISTVIQFNQPLTLATAYDIWITLKPGETAAVSNRLILSLNTNSGQWNNPWLSPVNLSPIATAANLYTTDKNPPLAPQNVALYTGQSEVKITWTNPTNRDLDKIRIGWTTNSTVSGPDDPALTVQEQIETNRIGSFSSLVIPLPSSVNRYYFFVYSADSAGNCSAAAEGSLSTVANVNSTDAAPPAGVQIIPGEQGVKLSWNSSANPDHSHYAVRIWFEGEAAVNLIEPLSATETAFKYADFGYTAGIPTCYISVVDVLLNGTRSDNDFTAPSEAYSKAKRTRYQPPGYNSGVVYKNMFRPDNGERSRILVQMGQTGKLSIKIYTISGRLIRTIKAGTTASGLHEFYWDGKTAGGTTVPSGLYLVHIRMDGFNRTIKCIVLRN